MQKTTSLDNVQAFFPKEAQALKHWITWRYVSTKEGKATKRPNVPGGKDWLTNPGTWHTLTDCQKEATAHPGYGLGFVLTDSGYICVDIDHQSKYPEAAQTILEKLNSYTEISPSGDGFHIWLKDSADTLKRNKFKISVNGQTLPIEAYSRNRFVTVTGCHVAGTPDTINANPEGLQWLLSLDSDKPQAVADATNEKEAYTDDEIVEFGKKVFGTKFEDLFLNSGESDQVRNKDNSQSGYDLPLMNMLCFLTGANKAQMKRLFLQSACWSTGDRKKGHEDDYVERTAVRALMDWNGKSYNPDYGRFPVMTEATEKKPAKPLKDNLANTKYLIEREGRKLRYNPMLDTFEVWRRYYEDGHIVWGEDEDYKDNKNIFLPVVSSAANQAGIGLKSIKLRNEYIDAIAYKNKYNPIQEYLKGLTWTGQDVITTVWNHVEIAPDFKDQEPLFRTFFKRFLIQAVTLPFNSLRAPIMTDYILILQGPQGVGKTRFVGWLSPYPDWVLIGGTVDPGKKDDLARAGKYWLVELGEIGLTLNAKSNDALKNYITQPFDEYRRLYDREQVRHLRCQSWIGTVNDPRFLTDPTGSRRFLVIPVANIDMEGLQDVDKNQLWAQAMHLKQTEDFHLSKEEQRARDRLNDTAFTKRSNEELALLDSYDWTEKHYPDGWKWRTATEIAEDLYERQGARMNGRVARAIRQIAKHDSRVKTPTRNGARKLYFFPAQPSKYMQEPDEEEKELFGDGKGTPGGR